MQEKVKHLEAQIALLHEMLADVASDIRCGCNHPACKSCERDRECQQVLSTTASDAALLLVADAIERLRFPVQLRKMWSGGEVQNWLSERADIVRSQVKGLKTSA